MLHSRPAAGRTFVHGVGLLASLLLVVQSVSPQSSRPATHADRATMPTHVRNDLPTNLRNDIMAGNQAWIDGFKAGDAGHMTFGFSDDSVDCNAAGECVKGLAAITARFKEAIARFGRATGAWVRSDAVRVDDDLAYESGYSQVHFASGAVRQGRFSTVWKRQRDGHWKIFRNMSLPSPVF